MESLLGSIRWALNTCQILLCLGDEAGPIWSENGINRHVSFVSLSNRKDNKAEGGGSGSCGLSCRRRGYKQFTDLEEDFPS